MKRLGALLLVLLATCVGAMSQTTAVSGMITDSGGQAFSNGTWQVQFHPNGFPPNTYNINGASFTQLFNGLLDVNGNFSVTLTDNSLITPAGSQWDFTVCPNANTPCTTVTLTISGATQDVGTAISSQVPPIGVKLDPNPNVRPFGRAYDDNEILFPMEGIAYYNVGDQCLHLFTRNNGWVKVCAGGGGGGTFNCASAINGAVLAATSTTAYSCDPNFLTDFFGHVTAQSFQTLAPYNGELQLTAKNAWQPSALPTNTVSWIAANVVTTPTRFVMPPGGCTDGQVLGQQSHDIDPTGTARSFINCINTGNILLQTNSVNNGSQSKLNLVQGTNITLADNGTGSVTITSTASGGGVEAQVNGVDNANCTAGVCPLINIIDSATTPAGLGLTWSNPSGGQWKGVLNDGTTRASNPVIPVATVNGTPGTTDYKYAVAYCQDINCVYHSALSPVKDVTTGAATITSVNSITLANYADTLYGYRFAVVCRTASSGSPASIGVIATGAGKSFTDTGLTGDASNCATTYASNTTILSPLPCLSSFSPGGNSPYGAPCGIDAPPLSPDATNSENSNQFGAPGDANDPWWIRVNAGAATFSWTGGTLAITNAAGLDQLNCVFHAVASTPYGYVAQMATNNSVGGHIVSYLALRESATGKIIGVGVQIQSGGNSMNLDVAKWTSATVNSSFPVGSSAAWVAPNSVYLKVGDNATNIEFLWSPDGLVYTSAFTEARGTFFTTAPDQVGYCIEAISGTGTAEYDYLRKVSF